MLSKQQMLDALDGLIQEAQSIYQGFLTDLQPWSPRFTIWLKASESTIEAIFGSTSNALLSFKSIYFIPPPGQQYSNDIERRNAELTCFASGLRYALSTLVGYRYSVDRLAPAEPARPNPYVFIAHGGPTLTHVHMVRDFLAALGLAPVVVKDLPNLNLSPNDKVRFYLSLCAGGVVLATAEDETIAQEKRARPNVEHEIGLLQAAPNIASRIVYMKEPDVKFASNYAEKVWISFSKDRVQDAFVDLAKELRAFRFLG